MNLRSDNFRNSSASKFLSLSKESGSSLVKRLDISRGNLKDTKKKKKKITLKPVKIKNILKTHVLALSNQAKSLFDKISKSKHHLIP